MRVAGTLEVRISSVQAAYTPSNIIASSPMAAALCIRANGARQTSQDSIVHALAIGMCAVALPPIIPRAIGISCELISLAVKGCARRAQGTDKNGRIEAAVVVAGFPPDIANISSVPNGLWDFLRRLRSRIEPYVSAHSMATRVSISASRASASLDEKSLIGRVSGDKIRDYTIYTHLSIFLEDILFANGENIYGDYHISQNHTN